MADQYISLKVILDKLHRNPLLSDVALETVVDYTIDFLRIVGAPQMFTNKIANITISSYKGIIPDDFYELIQVRENDRVLRATTNTYHLSEIKDDNELMMEDTFMIQGSYIYTTMELAELEMSYQAIATDDMGLPMMPDRSSFTRALEAYIKKQHYGILFDLGKLSQQVLFKADQDYAWAVGACETDAQRLNLSDADAFFNSYRTLLIRDNEFYNNFRNSGSKQILINH